MALSQPLIASALCSCYPPVVAASSEQLELHRFVLTASRTESLALVSSISEANKALLKEARDYTRFANKRQLGRIQRRQ
jgi:hypothetical protein